MAAKRIKGITIEIDGSTTGLDKALSGVNSNLSKTQSALRDVDRLLKIDPKNTELLSQKQKLLSQAVEETKEKLEIEKNALEQAAATDMPPDKMDALKREVIATTQELERLEKQAQEASGSIGASMQEVGGKIKDIGDKTTEVGKGFSTHVTAPIAAVGAASIAAFSEVDAGMDIIKQKTGAAGDALSGMEDIAKRIATNIPTDFETAGAAVGEVNTRFGLTGEELEKLSEKFIKFADLNNTDVSSSIDNTQKVLTAFGLTTEDAGAMLDTMNAVGQRTGIGMDDLTQSMITNSASLQQMGFDAAGAANFLGNVEVSGADTAQVMSGLTKALSNATAEGKPMNEALAEIQNSMVNAGSETEGLQAAYDLFGKKAGAAIYQACKEGSLSFEELGTSMQDNLGSIDKTYQSTLDGTDAFKTGMNELKVTGAELGEVVGNTIAPMIEKASEKIAEFTEWFSKLSPHTKETIVRLAMVAAAIGPVLVVIGTLISTIGTITGAIGTFISFLGGVSGAAGAAGGGIALFSGPLLPVIGIIGGVVAAGVALYKNWDTIKEKATELKDNVKEKFESVKESIGSAVAGAREKAHEKLSEMKEDFSTKVTGIRDDWTEKFTNIKNKASETMEGTKEKVSGKLSEIRERFSSRTSEIGSGWSEKFTNIRDNATNDMETARKNISEKLDNMKRTYDEKGGGMKGIASATFTGIKDVMDSQMTMANRLTGGKLDEIRAAFSNKMNSVKSIVHSEIEKIKGFFKFSWSLPKLKLPHFNISGRFSLDPPQVPHFGIEWYKKGGIMTKPTLFGLNGGNLMAGGEPGTGGEAILPLAEFYKKFNQIMDSKLAYIGEKIIELKVELPLYIDGSYSKTEIGEIAMKEINRKQKYSLKGVRVNARQFT